jgi:hypothetical protein
MTDDQKRTTEPDFYREIADVAERVQARAWANAKRFPHRKAAVLLGLFVKAWNTYRSTYLLYENGLGSEALVMTRVLLETVVNLRTLEADQNEELILSLYYFGLWKMKDAKRVPWLTEAMGRVLGEAEVDAVAELGEERWNEIKRTGGWAPSATEPGRAAGMKELIARHGIEHGYETMYNFGSMAVHGRNFTDYVVVDWPSSERWDLVPVRDRWGVGVCRVADNTILDCLTCVDRIFATGEGEALSEIERRLTEHNLARAAELERKSGSEH